MDVLQHKLVFVVETFSISLLVISKHVSRYPFSCQVEFLRVHSVAEQSSSVSDALLRVRTPPFVCGPPGCPASTCGAEKELPG